MLGDGSPQYDFEDTDNFEPMRRSKDNSLPASSKRASKNAARKTRKSRLVSKKISQNVSNIKHRRSKRYE